ncbi:ABC transporter ATP-binding protein [Wansuia hejianensis]|uniref:ABC transporter ATP-binding protein n=1 Tax=Wansuia hejianensis TaxID=2763667 RepID=A0A7G9GF31_9FIRM|nr:ABC transporter ATP-binding protein [Wansuia hejianensis]QNM09413.1 ABC transporter ATP-binding protein [Wansuia hejianensis]
MKRLLGYLRKNLKETILAPLFKMLEASFELAIPLVVARMIDVGIGSRDTRYILKMGGLMILLGIIGFISALTAQYFAAKAAVTAGTSMRNDLFGHIGTLSYREIDTAGTSTLITRMTSDINQVQNGVNMFLRLFLRSPFVVLGAMVMAFTVDTKTALSFALAIPVLFAVIFVILLVSMPLYQKVQKQLDRVLLKTRENLLGVRVVRAFNRQKDEMESFDQENAGLYRKQVFVGKISALLNPLTYIIINLGIVAILWIGGDQVFAGRLSQGQVIALINYMSQILVELIKLANLIILMSRAAASLKRVNNVFDMHSTLRDGSQPFTSEGGARISFHGVSFTYAGAKEPSLSNITFTAEPGQTIGIIGGTGSGKTTLVNLIPRFYDTTGGTVTVNGRDVRQYQFDSLREHIGVVPQKAALFRGTLRTNLLWGKEDATDAEIYEALDAAQAREFVDHKQQGLGLLIDQGGRNLSGGQKQRLTIARALVRRPSVLILDDSASALDFATDARLRKAIRETTGKTTVFLVSQRVATIKNADQILVLDDGRLAGIGTHKALLNSCGVYREICESQLTPKEVAADAQ